MKHANEIHPCIFIMCVFGRNFSDSEFASDLEFVKPVFGQRLQDQTVNEGEPARLDCTITGVPEPEVIWLVSSSFEQQQQHSQ